MISIDNLDTEIEKTLSRYSSRVTEKVKKAVEQVAKEVNKEIKTDVPFKNRTGRYIRSFRIKTTYEGPFNRIKTWYVNPPYSNLTHLLEKGHEKVNGGRVRAYPHISKGEQYAEKRMLELTEEAIRSET